MRQLVSSASKNLNDLFGCIFQNGERMVIGKVSDELHEQIDVGHLVQQVLILQSLWFHMTIGLHEFTSTFAVLGDHRIFDHAACLTFQVLHLV